MTYSSDCFLFAITNILNTFETNPSSISMHLIKTNTHRTTNNMFCRENRKRFKGFIDCLLTGAITGCILSLRVCLNTQKRTLNTDDGHSAWWWKSLLPVHRGGAPTYRMWLLDGLVIYCHLTNLFAFHLFFTVPLCEVVSGSLSRRRSVVGLVLLTLSARLRQLLNPSIPSQHPIHSGFVSCSVPI